MANAEKEWFGYTRVDPHEKTQLVHGVFENVAKRYDIMNDVMSGGLHRIWKNHFVRMIRPRPHQKFLDVAGGTGDIAFRIYKKTNMQANITVFDLNKDMLTVGQDRAIDKGWINSNIEWINGNAEVLPFSDNSYDVYTIAFGLRNVTHIDTALSEAYRVLKPGGRFYCLEFSHVRNPVLSKMYDIYSSALIPEMGKMIADDRESYQYLVESIRQFPKQNQLKRRIEDVGFRNAKFQDLMNGIVCIHSTVKF